MSALDEQGLDCRPKDRTTPFAIDEEPTGRVMLRASRDDVGDRVDLTVSVAAPSVVAVDPYPLADVEVAVEVASRVLKDRSYGSADEAAAAYHAAPAKTSALLRRSERCAKLT